MTKSERNLEEKYRKTVKRTADNIIIDTFCRYFLSRLAVKFTIGEEKRDCKQKI